MSLKTLGLWAWGRTRPGSLRGSEEVWLRPPPRIRLPCGCFHFVEKYQLTSHDPYKADKEPDQKVTLFPLRFTDVDEANRFVYVGDC